MEIKAHLNPTPWDAKAFGFPTFEVKTLSEEVLRAIVGLPGHYTVKVPPLSNKQRLEKHGFYYCDTLLEPYCAKPNFVPHLKPSVRVSKKVELERVLAICHGAFEFGRFYRDFNLDKSAIDRRYDNWLTQIFEEGGVYGLWLETTLAGFVAVKGSHLVLHVVARDFRGKGLAKYFWTAVCKDLYESGHEELTSSVSAGNVAVINLYASLGFRFRNPLDVYHRMIRDRD
jgi:ribosomal protein S18 acetylase RimI-like enzyme